MIDKLVKLKNYIYINLEKEFEIYKVFTDTLYKGLVKDGVRTTSKSLNEYIKKYNTKYSLRISEKNFGFENCIKSVPPLCG